jgi:hypothetical protein
MPSSIRGLVAIFAAPSSPLGRVMTIDPEDAWSRQGRPIWVSPRIMREYYAQFFAAHVQDPQHEIYRSVVGGTIRTKYKGRLLTTKEAAALAEMTCWDEKSPFALPSDIQLSVEDALMIFDLARICSGTTATP